MTEKPKPLKSLKPPGDPLEIVANGLSFGYGNQLVLKDFSLTFKTGRLYFLAGPNGAGKSTLLALLTRLKKPTQGEVLLGYRPLNFYSHQELARNLAFAPQKSTFNLAFTVEEVVAMGRRPYLGRWGVLSARDREIVAQSLDRLGLTALADRPITALSGGEAQRAVIARTLAQEAKFLLLDEPTASLDVAHGLELMALLRDLAATGRGVIVVSHDLALAAAYAQELILLKDGALVASGPLNQILTPELLKKVFAAEAWVRTDDFAGGLAVSFRRAKDEEA